MTKLTAAAIALVLAAGLAACGDDDSDGDNAASTPAASTPTQPATGADEVKVSMKDIKYVPASVTVNSGQKITWTNDDPVAHTVTARGSFDSGTIEPGGKFSQSIVGPGKTIPYVCTIHPNQKGTIIVR